MSTAVVKTNSKVHAIIHTASASSAGVGAGLAQIPGSDMPVLCGIQITMIIGIAKVHGHSITKQDAFALIVPFAAGKIGRAISQALIGWIPVLGNAINATTAATITESIGWAADAYFAE
jgi:uncharacterized protein (DUF697 family)